METLSQMGCCIHRVTFGDEDDEDDEMMPLLFENLACGSVCE